MDGFRSLTNRDQRNMAPQLGKPKDRATTTTASEAFATGKNALKEHMGTKGNSGKPGKIQGHGGS